MTSRPTYCCGKCPEIARGGYDCTCRGNPRCEESGVLLVVEFRLKTSSVINANHRLHWAQRSRLTKQLRRIGELSWPRNRRFERVQIDVHVGWPDKRRRDVANLHPTFKALVDGFTDAGMVKDDNDTHVRGPFLHPYLAGEKGAYVLRFEFTEVSE